MTNLMQMAEQVAYIKNKDVKKRQISLLLSSLKALLKAGK